MLSYTTLFIGSVIVSVIAIVVYRLAMGTSRSILSAKGPLSITTHATNPQSGHATVGVGGAAAWPKESIHAAPPVQQVREPQPPQATGDVNASHCSLYSADPTAPTNRAEEWPHREEKIEASGTAYKVTRKASPPS